MTLVDDYDQRATIDTLVIIVVTGIVFLYCHVTHKKKEAELYYFEFEPVKYYVLKFCYLIIVISFMFNARYMTSVLLSSLAKRIKKKFITS